MQAQDIQNNYEIRKLTANETIAAFDCEDNDLNEFILVDAPLYRKALLATTYIVFWFSRYPVVSHSPQKI